MSLQPFAIRVTSLIPCLVLASACAGTDGANLAGGGLLASENPIVRGIPDKGRDPAVVAIDLDGEGLCTGTLIAPDIVLTARHCVSRAASSMTCPSQGPQITSDRDPSTLRILAGDDIASAQLVARGRELFTPEGNALCDADIALIALDVPVVGIEPVDVREAGVAEGDRVRTVGFGRRSAHEPGGLKLLREHVRVLDGTFAEFRVAEATCQGDSGGPAFAEDDGQVVGVVSRGGASCSGNLVHNVYTRADAFFSLIDYALSQSLTAPTGGSSRDGGRHRDAGKQPKAPAHHTNKHPSDYGGACHGADDCAAAVCVTDQDREYCSRSCDPYDPCPTRFKCLRSMEGDLVCGEK